LAVANTVFHPPIAIPGPCMWCLARFAVHTLLHGTSSVHFPFPQPHACAAAALEVLHAPRLVSSSLARPSATCVRTRLRGHLQTCGAAPCRILCPLSAAPLPRPPRSAPSRMHRLAGPGTERLLKVTLRPSRAARRAARSPQSSGCPSQPPAREGRRTSTGKGPSSCLPS